MKTKSLRDSLDIRVKVTEKYGTPEEYLTNHYPPNYFDFFIDVGTRGTFNPWHINNIGKENPETTCFGFEPDTPYYKELVEEIQKENLSNVILHMEGMGNGEPIPTPQGEGSTVTLAQIFKRYKLDPKKKWMIKYDCEGCELALMNPKCSECLELLKQADHVAFEIHGNKAGKNYFTTNNYLPEELDGVENWLYDSLSETHTSFLTCEDTGMKTYVFVSDNIMTDKDNLFWKELI